MRLIGFSWTVMAPHNARLLLAIISQFTVTLPSSVLISIEHLVLANSSKFGAVSMMALKLLDVLHARRILFLNASVTHSIANHDQTEYSGVFSEDAAIALSVTIF